MTTQTEAQPRHAVLVHHIGHHDLYLIANNGSGRNWTVALKGRAMLRRTRQIAELLASRDQPSTWAQLERQTATLPLPAALPCSVADFREPPGSMEELEPTDAVSATAVRFPLLQAALAAFDSRTQGDCVRTLVLTWSPSLPPHSDSVVEVAHLLERAAPLLSPGLSVVALAPPVGDPFRVGPMEGYVSESLVPWFDRQLVELQRQDAKSRLAVYLSHNTGTSAAIWVLTNALRHLKPALVAIPKCRVRPITGEVFTAEVHEETWVDAAPARDAASVASQEFAMAIDELQRWKAAYVEAIRSPHHELGSFWLAKSSKPVLAVVVCRIADGSMRAFRGCNMEVSLPTGSLCAERNAISSALAAYPAMRRQDVACVAVYGGQLGDKRFDNPLEPCGVCREWLLKIAEINPHFRVITFADDEATRVHVRPVEG